MTDETRARHNAFIAKMQPRVDAIYAASHRLVFLAAPDRPNGPDGARYPTCGACGRFVIPNGRGGWRHKPR